jgi:hypothetical protein
MTKRVADVLIETLQAAGVERCYGIVGDTLNRIAHAIDRSAIGTRRPEGAVTLPYEERERSTPNGFSSRRGDLAPRGHRGGA